MPFPLRIHFDNSAGFSAPRVHVWYDASTVTHDLPVSGTDAFGPFFDFDAVRNFVRFKFRDAANGTWEPDGLRREAWPVPPGPDEIWCKSDQAFVYHNVPTPVEGVTAANFLQSLAFRQGMYVPGTGGFSGLGATPLQGGGVLFGLYHPTAARVYVAGTFNGWQTPGAQQPIPAQFLRLKLYRGWFGAANTWLLVVPNANSGDEYKFYVEGGVPRGLNGRAARWLVDPYARCLGPSFSDNNAVVVDPSRFNWNDGSWTTTGMSDLIIYEMSVYGFTEGDPGIAAANRGKFAGITERIRAGYFDQLGATALSLMPLAEFPSMQSPDTLGYNPSLYMTVERDFGTPGNLRELVDTAHQRGLAVLLDQVFNHTDNGFNPLWHSILEHPREDQGSDGGLYFNGETRWGNRVATEKEDVQNMLIDACKLAIREYHVDGFRFDATHSRWMDHGFLRRLADELTGFKPDVLLVAENLENEPDLNRSGFDGFAQWCDLFHDKCKALLREGEFEGKHNDTNRLGDMFFFSRDTFAAHTNNVVNYCESHDEHSVPFEMQFTPWLNHPAAKERKARLGLFATTVALGQPMIYMGQEFNTERPRNLVTVQWPGELAAHGYFQWASRLLKIRRRYPALRLSGYNPAADGRFVWIVAPWLDAMHGGGKRVIGWRAQPGAAHDRMVVLLNFEGHAVTVDLDLGFAGRWVKLADIDRVNDVPPEGVNSANDPATLHSNDGRFAGFVLPSTSGFIYKWEAP